MKYLLLPECLGQNTIEEIKGLLADDGVEIHSASDTKGAYRIALRKIRNYSGQLTCVCCTEKHDTVRSRMENLGMKYEFVPLENTECMKGTDCYSRVDIERLVSIVRKKQG